MDISSLTHFAQTKEFAVRLANEGTATAEDPAGTGESGSNTDSVAQDFDTFLELLTAQIRNQDPLAPLDSTQFVEQLATFSNLELQAKNTQILESIASMLAQQLALGSDGATAPSDS